MTSNLIEVIKQYDNLTESDKELFKKVINTIDYIHVKVGDSTKPIEKQPNQIEALRRSLERILKEQQEQPEKVRSPFAAPKDYPPVSPPIIDPFKPSRTSPYVTPTIWYQTFDSN